MRYGTYAFATLFLSCGTGNDTSGADGSIDVAIERTNLSELWVCHHPDTEFHGKACKEESFPDGCYIPGDNSKFCWLLRQEDCGKPNPEAWLFDHCKLLNKRE